MCFYEYFSVKTVTELWNVVGRYLQKYSSVITLLASVMSLYINVRSILILVYKRQDCDWIYSLTANGNLIKSFLDVFEFVLWVQIKNINYEYLSGKTVSQSKI